jgi:hypothetical protein
MGQKEFQMTATRTIQIGMVYSARLGKSFVPVQVLERIPGGRWKIQNLADTAAKPFTVKADLLKGDGKTLEDAKTAIEQAKAEKAADEKQAIQSVKDTPDVQPATKGRKQPAKAKAPGKMSGLDAVVKVLRETGKPMNTADMVKTALAKGYWSTGGKTPAATIYAAIITEIAKKGQQSRFRKVDRGLFELTDAGKAAK